ncbi:MAG TPA: hypothetical protein RMH99_25125 [Sandaracinaceae bacterium LLY-WYZ-13_1]|nr:hypothetical protein [Sandaracinaceae bacterium LLY-WYZ-13_1]
MLTTILMLTIGLAAAACDDTGEAMPGDDAGHPPDGMDAGPAPGDDAGTDAATPAEDGGPGEGDDAGSPGPTERLTPDDFTYRGAFRLPDAFTWSSLGITVRPDGDGGDGTLFVLGKSRQPAQLSEVSIPDPAIAPFDELPVAEIRMTPRSMDGDLIESTLSADHTDARGLLYVPQTGSQDSAHLYGAADYWYAVMDGTFPTIWMSELDGSDPRGLFHVGPEGDSTFHGNRTGDYLFSVPEWYAARYLGGRRVVAGKTRGAFGGSMGPTMFAFPRFDTEEPSGDLDALPMLYYPLVDECAGPNRGDPDVCDFPQFSMCDKWTGAAFVEEGDRRAIVLYGIKGVGNEYGPPSSPDACNPYQGYHCDPLTLQLLFYDVDEIGDAATGGRDPWSVAPYRVWQPDGLFSPDADGHSCGPPGGMTHDPATGRLFLVERGLGAEDEASVHVFSTR